MRKWRVWVLAIVVLGASTWGASWWRGRSEYTRFVSAPLKDGTRYTFLYPKRMKEVMTRTLDFVLEERPQPSFVNRWMAWLIRRPLSNTVVATKRIETFAMHDSKLNTLASFRKTERKPRWNSIEIWDSRSKVVFIVTHYRMFELQADFEHDDAILSRSFQILPPGVPVPSP